MRREFWDLQNPGPQTIFAWDLENLPGHGTPIEPSDFPDKTDAKQPITLVKKFVTVTGLVQRRQSSKN